MSDELKDAIGIMFFTNGVKGSSVVDVKYAAQKADIDEKFLSTVKPRSGFIRTASAMMKSGHIQEGPNGLLKDKLMDDENEIVFQFSKRFLESHGADYSLSAVLRYYKDTEIITCPANQQIENIAREVFQACMQQFTVRDIQATMQRVIDKECRKIHLRDGVYFVPMEKQSTLNKLQAFCTQLGFSFFQVSIGHHQGQQENILKAVVEDIRTNIEDIDRKHKELLAKGEFTERIAKNQIQHLQKCLRHYRELAESLQVEVGTLLDAAGDAGEALKLIGADGQDVLIQKVQKGMIGHDLVIDLVKASEKKVFEAMPIETSIEPLVDSPAKVDIPDLAKIVPTQESVEALLVDRPME